MKPLRKHATWGRSLAALSLLLSGSILAPSGADERPVELGDIDWRTDFDAATAEAEASGRPVLVLFTEIPGCDTVRTHGEEVLTHPLVVEAAETLFIPVRVRNNVRGAEREVLESFGEPTWNNPVVRIIAADRTALAPRLAGDHTVAGLVHGMVVALEAAGDPVPGYLSLLAAETRAARGGLARAHFGMHCFWSGEAGLGAIDGVVASRPGFLGFGEAVELSFDPRRIDRATLERRALSSGAADRVLGDGEERFRVSPKDDKYHLSRSSWRAVPMTAAQATRVNAALARRRSPAPFLSPRQLRFHESARSAGRSPWPSLFAEADLRASFARAEDLAASASTTGS